MTKDIVQNTSNSEKYNNLIDFCKNYKMITWRAERRPGMVDGERICGAPIVC